MRNTPLNGWPSSRMRKIALAAYAKLAGPALTGAGGRFLARGVPAQVYEAGLQQRTVLMEFDSVEAARAAHDSPTYQEALAALAGGADREIRIVEGVTQAIVAKIPEFDDPTPGRSARSDGREAGQCYYRYSTTRVP